MAYYSILYHTIPYYSIIRETGTAYIFSCLEYCNNNMLYYVISSKLLSRLEIVLNDYVCFIFGVHSRSSWKDVSVTCLAQDLHILKSYVKFRLLCSSVCMAMLLITSKSLPVLLYLNLHVVYVLPFISIN